VYVATGAHESKRLGLTGDDAEGVLPSIKFLKAYNLEGKHLAKGRVGIIGGGNAAIDAARVAFRQKGVAGVTVFYRRTRAEMPAYGEEIEAAWPRASCSSRWWLLSGWWSRMASSVV